MTPYESAILRDAALDYAARGWCVHPLRARTKIPLLAEWRTEATTDAARVRAWWGEWPDANIGLVPGASSLLVFDIDTWAAADEANSLGLYAVPTLHVATSRDRHHLYFRCGSPDRVPQMFVRDGRLSWVTGLHV